MANLIEFGLSVFCAPPGFEFHPSGKSWFPYISGTLLQKKQEELTGSRQSPSGFCISDSCKRLPDIPGPMKQPRSLKES